MFLFYTALETVDAPGEREKLEKIFDDYSKYVKVLVETNYPYLKGYGEDIVQTVFLLVVKKRELFVSASEVLIKSLLFDFTKGVCVNIIKKQSVEDKRIRELITRSDEPWVDKNDPERLYQRNESLLFTKDIINSLPYPAGEIVLKKYIFGFSNREIADMLEMSETNVSTILHRSLKKIKKELEGK